MIGYCATGNSGIEIAPIRQMNSATTQAKIGLSMKKLGIVDHRCAGGGLLRIRRHVGRGVRLVVQTCGLTLSPAANFWKPSTTTLSPAFRPSVTNHWPSCTEPVRTGCDRHAVIVLDDEHLAAAAAIALDRLLRHRDRIAVDALLDLHADIHARQQFALRIGEFAAQASPARYGRRPWLRRTAVCRAADRACRRRAPAAPSWRRARCGRDRRLSKARRS